MSPRNQEIVDTIIPEHKEGLKKTFWENIETTWDNSVARIPGAPNFDSAVNDVLDKGGEVGRAIKEARRIRDEIIQFGNDYQSLESRVSLPGLSKLLGDEATTPWSKIDNNVYARFITDGHFGDVGQLQVRVAEGRQESALRVRLDLAGLVADSGDGSLQPLSFSPLLGAVAIATLPADAPALLVAGSIAAIVAVGYATQNTDWDAVHDALERFGQSSSVEIKDAFDMAAQAFESESAENERLNAEAAAANGLPYIKAPEGEELPGFPGTFIGKKKTPVQGGGKLRPRWKDKDGKIYEWDYQHGEIEVYSGKGKKHLGGFDPNTGDRKSDPKPGRTVEP